VLSNYTPIELDERSRAIEPRNAFVISHLLQEVTRSGTAMRAQSALKRGDIYGKTGTTNDSMDAWFAGYHASLTAVTWIGYDTPRKLGDRETGGGLSLPVWITYMQHALKNTPVSGMPVPAGVVFEGNDWYFSEYTQGNGVTTLRAGRQTRRRRRRCGGPRKKENPGDVQRMRQGKPALAARLQR